MFIGYTPQLSTAVWVGYPNELRSMTSVHGISVAGGTFPAQIWHDYMEVALHHPEVDKGEFCPPFPEPQNPVEWIPFHGSSSDSSSSSCPDADVTGTGSSEGSRARARDSSLPTITRRPPSPTATARTRGHMRPVSARSPRRRRSRTRHRRRHRLRHRPPESGGVTP